MSARTETTGGARAIRGRGSSSPSPARGRSSRTAPPLAATRAAAEVVVAVASSEPSTPSSSLDHRTSTRDVSARDKDASLSLSTSLSAFPPRACFARAAGVPFRRSAAKKNASVSSARRFSSRNSLASFLPSPRAFSSRTRTAPARTVTRAGTARANRVRAAVGDAVARDDVDFFSDDDASEPPSPEVSPLAPSDLGRSPVRSPADTFAVTSALATSSAASATATRPSRKTYRRVTSSLPSRNDAISSKVSSPPSSSKVSSAHLSFSFSFASLLELELDRVSSTAVERSER